MIPTVPLYGHAPACSRAMKAMRWTTATQLFCTYVAAWMIDVQRAGRRLPGSLHRSFGMTILLAAAIRLAIRQRNWVSPLSDDLPQAQHIAATPTCFMFC